MKPFAALLILTSCLLLAGCNSEPPLHPISGQITLGGKPYERLIVYFRPLDGKVTKYNLGVGETDASGKLFLRSTAGEGLAAGNYRVSFTCIVSDKGQTVGSSDEKADDDRRLITKELVPAAYGDGGESALEFEVVSGPDNRFEFDIPAEKS
ncbi:hypothetical protein FF011L_17540 [Roseimaritima multifibrata]|uniref:Secreted protein n=1 Tax=Roseimaritima multifibrata TaxID=1930274 RepID=A0A517MDN4_9BACT|nr:hypothetical protein [Roseimaritima multifibrata]QDS92999.1 hypothetical protein FF011L_17540 [Roseimaritima multifibrata]